MSWRLIEEDKNTDIFSQLSIEEALAEHCTTSSPKLNTLRFWRADRAVVMGRFQCVHKEVNLDFCTKTKICIARRFTGGGTVFHDLGNLNITLCMDQNASYVPNRLQELYDKFIGAISFGLQELGIPASHDKDRNCIRVGSRKITGTAGWTKRGVSFIHATLLIDSDIETLEQALKVPNGQPVYHREKMRVRCKDSKRDIVTTLERALKEKPSDPEIKEAITSSLEKTCEEEMVTGILSDKEIELAHSLYQSRYSNPEWNMGILAQDE